MIEGEPKLGKGMPTHVIFWPSHRWILLSFILCG